jgi:hypothetical protein
MPAILDGYTSISNLLLNTEQEALIFILSKLKGEIVGSGTIELMQSIAGFLPGIIFDPEDEAARYFDEPLPNYMVLQPRRSHPLRESLSSCRFYFRHQTYLSGKTGTRHLWVLSKS